MPLLSETDCGLERFRYRLLIEYDGSYFHGWQRQKDVVSVQSTLERALHSFCGKWITVHGAGRTDCGVHALGQVAHIDVERKVDAERLKSALNFYLNDKAVVILESTVVSKDFDARFSAVERHYLYRILCSKQRSPLRSCRVYCVHRDLDLASMRKAAVALLGYHDYTTFRSAHCQSRSAKKSLLRLEIKYQPCNNEFQFFFVARSFMRHQVRSMVGSLLQVGLGRWPAERISYILSKCDRSLCGPLCPSYGLYLARVIY